MEKKDSKKKELDLSYWVQRTVGRLGKQEFHAEDTISQLPLGAVQLLICKSVTRKGENGLEKNIFKVKKKLSRKIVHVSMCPFSILCKLSLCFSVIQSFAESVYKYVDLNHDKHVDINRSSAAPYKGNLCIILCGTFNFSLRQYYKMGPYTVSCY